MSEDLIWRTCRCGSWWYWGPPQTDDDAHIAPPDETRRIARPAAASQVEPSTAEERLTARLKALVRYMDDPARGDGSAWVRWADIAAVLDEPT